MKRKRLTQVFPFLLPIRKWQRKKLFYLEMLIDGNKYANGFEVGCAVLGIDELIVGRIDEIELSSGFFDYIEKYTLKSSKIYMPARIDAETEKEYGIQQLSSIRLWAVLALQEQYKARNRLSHKSRQTTSGIC